MEGTEQRWRWAIGRARRFLRRFGDRTTCAQFDDLIQDASLLAWQWAGQLNDPAALGAALRTILRRQRTRALGLATRRQWLVYTDFGVMGVAEPCAPEAEEPNLNIAGRAVSVAWARARLSSVLARLTALDRQLLLGFHEGFCCAELAHRFDRSEDCVKTRIHRARRRVRTEFESIVRAAGDLDAL